jgi:hypothetical protein
MSAAIPLTAEIRAFDTLESLLSPIHDLWIEEVERVLAPVMAPHASFWERWSAVRYLTDQFEDRFRLEYSLTDSSDGLLKPKMVSRLDSTRTALEFIRVQLIASGRRRGTSGVVAGLAGKLLQQAKLWCAQLEFAMREVRRDDLSRESRRLLEHLETAAGLGL